ncbi:MAG: lmo0937 family membrane protein [Candidatus Acidiferrales bacterium]
MLAAVFIIFLALWILGVATSCMFGGFIHILLALAVVTGLIRFIQDLRVAS